VRLKQGNTEAADLLHLCIAYDITHRCHYGTPTSCRIPLVEYRHHRRSRRAQNPRSTTPKEERREAARQSERKYTEANREAIKSQRVKARKSKRAAIKAGQKEASAETGRPPRHFRD